MVKLNKLVSISLVKTFIYNIKFLGLKKGIKFPLRIFKNTVIKGRGRIELVNGARHINIGQSKQSRKTTIIFFDRSSTLILHNNVQISGGCVIKIWNNAVVDLGAKCNINVNTCIDSTTMISIGTGSLISAECYMMDTDWHTIKLNNKVHNYNEPVKIGKHVWIGLRATILKGTYIPDNTIIGANSLVSRKFDKSAVLIAGNPAHEIQDNIYWDASFPLKRENS